MSGLPEMQILHHRDLNPRQARTLTERIRSAMGDLMAEVAKAWIGRVWLALGYESWEDYCKGEFVHSPLSLPRDERKAVVIMLRSQGMSTRAIGAAAGVSDGTVRNDLATAQNYAVDEASVIGLDGRTRTYTITDRPIHEVVPPHQTTTCPTCGGTGRVTQ